MKHKKLAFTLVELLTVLAIIAILVALLIPALAMVRNMARETQQKAQLTTIEMGLMAFRNDDGDYPHSDWTPTPPPGDYCGAQKLAEALVGWDLMGFHPDSSWDSDGTAYDPPDEENLQERVGPYLELATANAFRLEQLFDNTGPLEKERFVLCDVFGRKSVTIGTGTKAKTVKAGAPILYYRANTSSKTMEGDEFKRIYNRLDNDMLVFVKQVEDGVPHPLAGPASFFYEDYIADPKITPPAPPWPYRPDSYILISAGADGLYGTSDDIRNF